MRLMDWIALCVVGPIALSMVVLLIGAFTGMLGRGRRGRCVSCFCDDVNLGWCDGRRHRRLDRELHCRDCCADPDDWIQA